MKRITAELWRYRALLWALVERHLHARYRGSLLGFVWSFLNPLCLIAVYSLVFQYYIRFESVQHYTLFLFAGLLPWIWFSSGLLEATASISSGGSLITKALFPPHILPLVAVLTNLMNFLFAVPLLVLFMLISGVLPGASLLMLPVVIALELLFLAGLSLALAALNVHFRDIQHILGNLLTLWFFLCPILYPVETVPEAFRFTLIFNPVALFTEMYQLLFLENAVPPLEMFVVAAGMAFVTLLIGGKVFNYYRDEFAELI
ncbi:MAG: ABC transporter permease [Bdellovibrionales bacterium]|nr:ABC transporter permease [Bdellovibrionales bacterium]